MGEVNLLRSYPRTKRLLSGPRSLDPGNRALARRFGEEYFDGTREQGYGGYRYDGRWVPVARDVIAHFGLRSGHRVLDIGCAKGFLVKDLIDACPGLEVVGLDVSEYALLHAAPEACGRLARATVACLPFNQDAFDAVLCINVVHNLERDECLEALSEIERVSGGRAYVQVDAFRTPEERDVFEQWVLTAITYLDPEGWRTLFDEAGYTGDYYWTVLEADPAWTSLGSEEAST